MSSESPQGPNRLPEMPAVKTTIVGGRPPGSGAPIGPIPRGLEILIKKAAVDPDFKALLLEKRSAAAAELELALEPAEAAMLDSVPIQQLEAIIANTKVPEATRRALLGKVTVGTLAAALGVVGAAASLTTLGHRVRVESSAGNRPVIPAERPEQQEPTSKPDLPPSRGIQPDHPSPQVAPKPPSNVSRGVRPDRPPGRPAE
jgi:hypothetical protein